MLYVYNPSSQRLSRHVDDIKPDDERVVSESAACCVPPLTPASVAHCRLQGVNWRQRSLQVLEGATEG